MHRSTLTDTLTVHAGDLHRAIAPGDLVDLAEPIGETTLGALLGEHVAAFAELAAPGAALAPVHEPIAEAPTRTRRSKE